MTYSSQDPNAGLLFSAIEKLAPLLDQIAFVGGCATGLLITDPAAAPVRPTLDVDAIVEIGSYAEMVVLEKKMEQMGFEHSVATGAPICRWTQQELIVDLMPADPIILGFSNSWYRPALQNAEKRNVGGYEIRVIAAPYFLATKLEAFRGRGNNDHRLSHDVEDIITVLDGRAAIVAEVRRADLQLQLYLGSEFSALLQGRDFMESLPGHLLPDEASQQRIGIVVARMRQIAGGQ